MSKRPPGVKPDDLPRCEEPEKKRASESRPVDPVDETSKESFPASDPPSWTPQRSGAPDKRHPGE